MAAADQHERAADLLERLLTDKKFRASFRKNPAAAAKKYGLDELAEEYSGQGKALYTLEIRESRSSLAGMMMAAAAEGVSASDLSAQGSQGKLEPSAKIALTKALSRVDLAAVPDASPGAVPEVETPGVETPGIETAGDGSAAGAAAPASAPSAADAAAAELGIEPVDPNAPIEPGGGGQNVGLESGVFRGVIEAVEEKQAPRSSTLEFAAVDGNGAAAQEAAAPPQQPQQPPDQVAPVAGTVLPEGPTGYPGDNAPKEQIAAWMAREAQKAGLPAELPVMAALVESNLTNVNYGDADSLGYFQMRTSIWDQGEYAGFSSDPQKQIKWFIDHAVHERDKRVSRGDSTFLSDPNKWGEWIADVERPAEQYRGRYQLRLEEARQLLAAAGTPPSG